MSKTIIRHTLKKKTLSACIIKLQRMPENNASTQHVPTKIYTEYRTTAGFTFVIYDPPAMTCEIAIDDTSDVL